MNTTRRAWLAAFASILAGPTCTSDATSSAGAAGATTSRGHPAAEAATAGPSESEAAAPKEAESPSRQAPQPAAAGERPAPQPAAASDARYPGSGFVVHEWGTNTVLIGSDGTPQRGLHHPGDDLPAFVYDRSRSGDLVGFPAIDKMETPVDYFYSDRPLRVKVRVEMPRGILTEWYPAVSSFAPAVLIGPMGSLVDPALETDYPYQSETCAQKYASPGSGMLDWGDVDVLAPDAAESGLPDAPLERFTWSHAREVAANLIQVNNPTAQDQAGNPLRSAQQERFLFYRGLGNFETPLALRADSERIHFSAPSEQPIFVLNVGSESAGFLRVDPGQQEAAIPSNEETPIEPFVETLAREMTEALVDTGLYGDEARAMVATWRRQWFRTPGVRALYFAPESWIDREVPLLITPAPDRTLRVMVLRVEVLTPSQEQLDSSAALELGAADPQPAREHFRSLGRFAEPRLRRALQLLGERAPLAASGLLAEIEGPNQSWAAGE
jgi:hypothetical protein